MRSRPGVIPLMDLSNVTLAPNEQAIGGETLAFGGFNAPEIDSLPGEVSRFRAREEKRDREGDEGDDGGDLKRTLIARR
jgi:hypothetical protein